MPYIDFKTTKKLTPESKNVLKAAFGKAIESFPGKTEAWLMVNIEDSRELWFKGDNSDDSAIIDVAIFSSADKAAYDRMTEAVTSVVSNQIGISPDRIYIKYSEVEHWGWNGRNF